MKKCYAKFSILLSLGVIFIASCKKEVVLEPNTWIESINRKDTLIFKNDFLILNRSRELSGGFLLPKIGAGPYFLKESKDSISLMYSLSSLYKFNSYAFKIENNTLYIGDFYEKSGKLLVFKKIN